MTFARSRPARLSALALGCASLMVAAALVLILALPASAAIVCPTCYGFAPAGGGLYVEADVSPEARAKAARVVAEARDRVGAFYGTRVGHPALFLCADAACYARIGGGSRGMAILDWALFLSPRGSNPVIAAHELSHIELHARLGLWQTWRRAVPQWFDEGLAVVVSDDPRYLAPAGRADRCRVRPDGPLPTDRAAWIERAQNDDVYAKAACRVDEWLAQKGGGPAVDRLAARVAAGESFEDAAR